MKKLIGKIKNTPVAKGIAKGTQKVVDTVSKHERKIRPQRLGIKSKNPFKHSEGKGSSHIKKQTEKGAKHAAATAVAGNLFPGGVAGALVHPALGPVTYTLNTAVNAAAAAKAVRRSNPKLHHWLANRKPGGQTPAGKKRGQTYSESVMSFKAFNKPLKTLNK